MYKHNFGWGDTFGIRADMLKIAPWLAIQAPPVVNFGYPKHEGEDRLVELVKQLCKRLTGIDYKYILITQGCTNALNAYIHAVKKGTDENLACRSLYFGFYPGIAENHKLKFAPGKLGSSINSIQIVDSPSNPEGLILPFDFGEAVWDAAYHTPTYGVKISSNGILATPHPAHAAMAGSISKLTGINGIRLGWLATNNEELYLKASKWITYDLCGVSGISQWLAEEILSKVDLDSFWKLSERTINNNKNEIQKLSTIFGNQKIPEMGMFALFEVDHKLKKLLEKASVLTTSGKSCGDIRDSVRINLAHTNSATRAMVKDILKIDKR